MKKLLCRVFGHKMTIRGLTGQFIWCRRCAHRQEVPQNEIIGPDGMTDCGREMKTMWARRDAAMEKVTKALAERTGIEADLIPHLPYEFTTLVAVLGVRVDQ